MAEKQETIADIIAWLRRPREGENAYLTLWRDEIADRLEAAHNRELSKNVSKNGADFGQLGNAAKLREAVNVILRLADEQYKIEGDYGGKAEALSQISSIAVDALDAPPRNCERFATVKDAAIAFARERQDAPQPCPDFTFSAWLLAPATEKEGGAK